MISLTFLEFIDKNSVGLWFLVVIIIWLLVVNFGRNSE